MKKVVFQQKQRLLKKKMILIDSFDGPFQLLHADVGNLEFLRKSATDPKYCLLFVDLLTSKVYIYPMKSRKSILNKTEIFHKEDKVKEKVKKQDFKLTRNLSKGKYLI